jgi:cold shock CspA family protein
MNSMEKHMGASRKNWQVGTVHWFDEKSGEGMIRSEAGDLFYVHKSAIGDFLKAKKNKEKALKDKQKIKYQLIDDVTFVQVSKVKEL